LHFFFEGGQWALVTALNYYRLPLAAIRAFIGRFRGCVPTVPAS
jgi:hypothetical protein